MITGAGGGLGSALAGVYAQKGSSLCLWGRDGERLERVRALCQGQGAQALCVRQDIRDADATRATLLALDDAQPLDLIFLNAGVSAGTLPGGGLEPAEDAFRILQVNAACTIAMAGAILERMQARGAGHLVFISSLAALYPLPASPSYCAAKTAVRMYARAVRLGLAGSGVRVSIVCPGYVDTPMSRRLKGPQPLRWSAEKAAAHIRSRLDAGADDIMFPLLLALGIRTLHVLPRPLAAFFARRFSFTIEPDRESPHAGRQAGHISGDTMQVQPSKSSPEDAVPTQQVNHE